jgi:erythromycin esterase-like protein
MEPRNPSKPVTPQGEQLEGLSLPKVSTPISTESTPVQTQQEVTYLEGFPPPTSLKEALGEELQDALISKLSHSVISRGTMSLDEWAKASMCDGETLTQEAWNPARVVGLGECTHGTKEHFEMQAAGARYIIREQNARIIALEVPELFVMLANIAIETQNAPLDDIPRSLSTTTWSHRPIIDLLTWIRTWNSDHPNQIVQVIGLDPKISYGNSLDLECIRAFNCVSSKFADTYLPIAKEVQELESSVWQAHTRRLTLEKPPEDVAGYLQLTKAATTLVQRSLEIRTRIESALGVVLPTKAHEGNTLLSSPPSIQDGTLEDTEALLALHLARSLIFLDSVISIIQKAHGGYHTAQCASRKTRDWLMYLRVKSALGGLDSQQSITPKRNAPKVGILGHTVHVGVNNTRLPHLDDLGWLLYRDLRQNLFAFGASNVSGTVRTWKSASESDGHIIAPHYGSAPDGSLEEALHRCDKGDVFLPTKVLREVLTRDETLALRSKGVGPPIANEFISGIDAATFLTGLWCFKETHGVEMLSPEAKGKSQERLSAWLKTMLADPLRKDS